MPTYVALLRAVNVTGRNRISMDTLRTICTSAGCSDVRTILQSGNAVFRSKAKPDRLAKTLEQGIREGAGIDVSVIVRDASDLARVVAGNPFPDEAENDPGHLLVVFLDRAPAADAGQALEKAIAGRERMRLVGNTLYAHYPDGVGTSKLTSSLIERKLDARGTARNWNTVMRLLAMVG